MIGDRKFDIIGAKQCGIKSVGVLCGFGSEDELKEYKADFKHNNGMIILLYFSAFRL